jgi:hypothetical protein
MTSNGRIETWLQTELAAREAARGRPARVDISPAAVSDPDYLEHVIGAVRRHRAHPRLITFAFAVADAPRSQRLAGRLAACGFGLSLVEQ